MFEAGNGTWPSYTNPDKPDTTGLLVTIKISDCQIKSRTADSIVPWYIERLAVAIDLHHAYLVSKDEPKNMGAVIECDGVRYVRSCPGDENSETGQWVARTSSHIIDTKVWSEITALRRPIKVLSEGVPL